MRVRTARKRISPLWAVAGLAAWIALIVHCWHHDVEAVKLAMILPSIFGLALLMALKLRSTVLTIFMGFTFISHAIAPAFFFLQKKNYRYSGDWGAVKDFGFGAGELLHIYRPVFLFTAAVLVFAGAGIRMTRGRGRRRTIIEAGPKKTRAQRAVYDVLIIVFLIAIAVPQSIVMYRLRVGLTGVVSPILPFRLTGILYYSRGFLYPLLLFVAYSLSKRKLPTTIAIMLYAWLAGLCASSRYVLLVSMGSVLLFAFLDRRRVRFVIAAAIAGFAFMTVTYSRTYIYVEQLPLDEYIINSIEYREEHPKINFWDLVGGIAMRLYGPQDVVLAYQYDVPSRSQAIANWFTDRPVLNLNTELYGMDLPEGSGFGVGIGLHAWMVLLSRRSTMLMIFLAAVISALLVLADIPVEAVRRVKIFKVHMAADPLAFFLVFVLYSAASLRWYYELIALSLVGTWILRMIFMPSPVRRPLALNGTHV
jgi:hypothetical protein